MKPPEVPVLMKTMLYTAHICQRSIKHKDVMDSIVPHANSFSSSDRAKRRSSTLITRGGPILILLPDADVSMPLLSRREASCEAVKVSVSAMNTDQKQPRPWYDARCGDRICSSFLPMMLPNILDLAGRSSSSVTSMAARAAAHATGLPAKVEPCLRRR